MGWLLGNRGQRPNFDEKWAAKGGGGVLMGNRLALLIQVGQAVKQAGEGQLGQGELERMQEKGAKGRVVEIDGTSCHWFQLSMSVFHNWQKFCQSF